MSFKPLKASICMLLLLVLASVAVDAVSVRIIYGLEDECRNNFVSFLQHTSRPTQSSAKCDPRQHFGGMIRVKAGASGKGLKGDKEVRLPVNCSKTDNASATLVSMNTPDFIQFLNASDSKYCVLVAFYSQYCIFSSQAGPGLSAVSRAYNGSFSFIAIDALSNPSKLTTRFGVLGTPTIIFLHGRRIVSRYYASNYTIPSLLEFVRIASGQTPVLNVSITDGDLDGPIPSIPLFKMDWALLLSFFVTFCILCHFTLRGDHLSNLLRAAFFVAASDEET